MSSSLTIGVKTMGEIDLNPFLTASNKLNKSSEEAMSGSIQLCCSWRENIKDPTCHPFKVVKNGDGIQVNTMIHFFLSLTLSPYVILRKRVMGVAGSVG